MSAARSFPAASRAACAAMAAALLAGPSFAETGCNPAPAANAPGCGLEVGSPTAGKISRGQRLSFVIDLTAEAAYHITVAQDDIDLKLLLHGPRGQTAGPFDAPFREFGWEQFLFAPEQSGEHRVIIEAIDASNLEGHYTLSVTPFAPKDIEQPCSLEAAQWVTVASSLDLSEPQMRSKALDLFDKASESNAACGATAQQARAVHGVAAVLERMERYADAVAAYRRAAKLYTAAGYPTLGLWAEYFAGGRLIDLDKITEARAIFETALAGSGDDPRLRSALQNYVGVTHYYQADYEQAQGWWVRALDTLSARHDPHQEATLVYNLGWLHKNNGEPVLSLDYFARALELEASLADDSSRGDILMSIGEVHAATGGCSEALQFFDRARVSFEQVGIQGQLAQAARRTADCYLQLGRSDLAETAYRRAAAQFEALGAGREQAAALMRLGEIARTNIDYTAASSYNDAALAIQRKVDNPKGTVEALLQSTRTALARGDSAGAAVQVDEALEQLARLESKSLEFEADLIAGLVDADSKRPDRARTRLRRAASNFATLHESAGQVEALLALAELEYGAGNPDEALDVIEAVLPVIEAARARIGSPDLRATFFQSAQALYELKIDALMSLYAAGGDSGDLHAAFSASDQARARTLRDVLDRGRNPFLQRAAPALADERKALRRSLTATIQALHRANSEHPDSPLIGELEAAVQKAQTRFDVFENRIQGVYPELAGAPAPEQDIAVLQQRLIQGEALLHFETAERRSFAWLIEPDNVTVETLASQSSLDALVSDVYDSLKARDITPTQLAALSDALLGVLSGRSAITRLLIVADGPVNHVPFATLYWPGTDRLLIERAEIVQLPAARTRRTALPEPTLTNARIAILADPVFTKNQLASQSQLADDLSRSLDALEIGQLRRLGYTRLESRKIQQLAGRPNVYSALGLNAQKQLLLDGTLADYAVVHLATHGLVNTRHPELSGLVFSMVDKKGAPIDGFLRLGEIYNLQLQARLVVLSACQSAVGPQVRGEGLISLARGFMQSGADEVVASRWQVPDRATAELMSRFYEQLLVEESSVATALRRAQLELRADRRWRNPYYWAGFTVWSAH